MSGITEIVKEVVAEIQKNYYLVPRGVMKNGGGASQFINYAKEFVCRREGIVMEEMMGSGRFGYLVEARQMCFLLVRNLCPSGVTHKLLAASFNKNVETIKFHARKCQYYMKNDNVFRKKYMELEAEFLMEYKEEINKVV